jgi:arginine:pyruvate transaminase
MKISRVSQRLAGGDGHGWNAHNKGLALQAAGQDVILLSVGDPDFATPEPIFYEALAAMKHDRTHYSPSQGEPALRAAIAALETATSDHPCDPDEVVVFPGATNAIYAVLSCLVNPGDEILVPEPMYVGYWGITAALGLRVRTVPLDCANNFALDAAAVRDAITDDTRVVMVNTPGNPGGNIITREQLADLASHCRDRDIWLLCDEVYSLITYKQRHVSLRASARSLDNTVMVDGLSKSHAMSGWRVGWAVAPRELVPHLARFAGATMFGCPQFIQDASAYALGHNIEHVERMRREYQRRRDYVVSRVNTLPGLRCQAPDAGMFVMVDVSARGMDGDGFTEWLLEQARVTVVPGSAFGPSGANFVRVTLCQPMDVLARALDRLETLLRAPADGSVASRQGSGDGRPVLA